MAETCSGHVRHRGVSIALVSIALAVGIANASAADSWQSYTNERFGATADLPTGWTAGEPPANGDGLAFTSPNGEATEIVAGGLAGTESIAQDFQIYSSPDDGETITYKKVGKHSIVVSGTAGDRIFYRKSILACRDQVWDTISLEYPAAKKADYDAIVTHVAKSLRAVNGYQIDHCP
jgi:hypothetical protein